VIQLDMTSLGHLDREGDDPVGVHDAEKAILSGGAVEDGITQNRLHGP
jgi:hypothetical protein